MTELENDLIVALMPYINQDFISEAKMAITIALSKYDVSKVETALTVYEGDVNEQILKKFLSAKIASGKSRRTVGYYRQSIMFSLERIGKPYMDVTADDIRLYLAVRIHQDKVSKTTANNERRNLSSFYSWLQKEEILLKNPMSKIDSIKESKTKKKAFEQMELEELRYACRSARETAMIEVLLSTWCRVSEVVQIRIDEIRGDKLTAHGKGDKDREVYLNARSQLAVKKYLEERTDSNPYLFPKAKYAGSFKQKHTCFWYQDTKLVDDESCMDAGSLESIVRGIGKRAGVPNTHPHRFRRTGATMALRSGMPLIQVSKLLGHENISTTQIYLDISDEELEQAHRKYVV